MHCDVGCCRSGAMCVLAHHAWYHGRTRCLARMAVGTSKRSWCRCRGSYGRKRPAWPERRGARPVVARRSPLLLCSHQAGARHRPGARRLCQRPVAPWPNGDADVGAAVSDPSQCGVVRCRCVPLGKTRTLEAVSRERCVCGHSTVSPWSAHGLWTRRVPARFRYPCSGRRRNGFGKREWAGWRA